MFGFGRKKSGVEKALDAYIKHEEQRVKEIEREEEARMRRESSMAAPCITRKRYAPVKKSRPFPLGVLGLVPLETIYKNGSTMCWIAQDAESCALLTEVIPHINQALDLASEAVGEELGGIDSLAFAASMLIKPT